MKRTILLNIVILLAMVTTGCTVNISLSPPETPASPDGPANNIGAGPPALPPSLPPALTPTPTDSPTLTATPTLTASPTLTQPTGTATLAPPSPVAADVEAASLTEEFDGIEMTATAAVAAPTTVISPTLMAAQTNSQAEATATPTASPVPTPTSSPTVAPLPTQPPSPGPTVRESSLTINTYDYQSALVPTALEDPVYPYPRLNHDQVGPPAPKAYQAIILENRYTQLTILPELGGRIYRWIDKTSGQNLFYENPVVKPTTWGHRGWWLATGGLEWALPFDEHGLSEASPWEYTLHQAETTAAVTLTDTEEHSGLVSEITISLDKDHAYFTLTPRIINPTNQTAPYKFWLNGMFGLGSTRPGSEIEFVLPTNQVTVHSTGDPSLPGEKEVIDWPLYQGRNLSDYGNWQNYLGVFAAPRAGDDFMGAYNHQTNLGVARVFPHSIARGAKIFGPANLDPALWTTDGSSYFELWGGLAPTFWDEVSLAPEAWVTWQEKWYAIGDMGGFKTANEEAALNMGVIGSSVQVAAASTHFINGQLVLWRNGQEVTRWPVSLVPEAPFRGSFNAASTDAGQWGLSLFDGSGREVAKLGQTQATAGSSTPVPGASPAAAGLPTPTPKPAGPVVPSPTQTATPAPTPISSLGWDSRLTDLGIQLSRAEVEAGQPVFRLVSARYLDEWEAHGLHHVQVEVLDENGQRIVGQPVILAWKDGQSTLITEDKPAPEYAANVPLYGSMEDGTYKMYVDGAPSDMVSGLGLPAKHHVSYQLIFQRTVGGTTPPPLPTQLPTATVTATPSASVTPASSVTPVVNGETIWDPRLNDLGITLEKGQPQADQPVFRLVSALYQDHTESANLHHVFVEVLDENGQRLLGQPVILKWGDGQATLITEDKPSPEYAANAPLYGMLGEANYDVYVEGAASDTIRGLGLPGKHHVNYLLTFQRKLN